MRQGSPPKRGRGRSGGRRGYVNPANRTYDSNGPDVKVRGTAAHIYDKYQALARDASSSGDRISAENYLQHAEHYFRLMNAHNAQQQQQQQNGQARANGQPMPNALGGDDAGDDDEFASAGGNGRGAEAARGEAGGDPGSRPRGAGSSGAGAAAADEGPETDEQSEEALI